MSNKSKPAVQVPLWLTLVALLFLAAATFLGKSDQTSLRGIDSNIHAAASMDVTSQGIKPKLPIRLRGDGASPQDQIFNDHPFTLFWLNGWVMRLFGPTAWSARLLTGLFAVGCVALVFLLGRFWLGEVFGILAASIALFSRDFILTSATMSLDTALVFFVLLTFWFWVRKQYWALTLAAGFGLWIKTPVVLLVYPTAVVVTLIEQWGRRNGDRELRLSLWPVVLSAGGALVLGASFWGGTALLGGGELVADYWGRQLWGTAVGGRGAGSFDPGFFFYTVRTGFLPGLPILIWALYRIGRNRSWRTPAVLIPGVAAILLGVTVTGMRFKLGHYYTPIFPFLALLAAHAWAPVLEKKRDLFFSGIIAASLAILGFLCTTPISLGPEGFVALRRFVPFVLKHGDCSDRVVLVPGGEPVGSALDARLFLNFYSGRVVETVDCQALKARVARELPAWLILSEENLRGCLDATTRARFKTQLLVGNQMLLSSRMPQGEAMDLTPLHLDLQAARDCQAPPYPQDLWHRYKN